LVSGCCMYTFITGTLCFFLIEELRLIGDGFIGTIPSEFGRMTNMKSFSVTTTSVEGTIPPAVFDGMRKLQMLYISESEISGKIPTEIGLCVDLDIVWFGFVDLSGTIPTEVGLLTSLGAAGLQDAGFTGTLPTELGHCSLLQEILLSSNDLQGTIPTELAGLTRLSTLDLANVMNLTPPVPEKLCNLEMKTFVVESYMNCECCTNEPTPN